LITITCGTLNSPMLDSEVIAEFLHLSEVIYIERERARGREGESDD
jgi:hypothetical protein